jgi:hypothetical protein
MMACRRAAVNEDGDRYCEAGCDVCDYTFFCNICGADAGDAPCPDHAPLDVPGLVLVECDATPQHPRSWVLAGDAYPPPCHWCAYQDLADAHAPCRHARHGAWRRWTITHKMLGWLYALGVIGSRTIIHDRYCDGCTDHIRFGRNGYLLGWPRWKWQCLLQQRHRPGVEILSGICGKCCPCPGCGSVTWEHEHGCEVAA